MFFISQTSIFPDGERELALLPSTGGVVPPYRLSGAPAGRTCTQSHHHGELACLPLPSSRTSTSVRTLGGEAGVREAQLPLALLGGTELCQGRDSRGRKSRTRLRATATCRESWERSSSRCAPCLRHRLRLRSWPKSASCSTGCARRRRCARPTPSPRRGHTGRRSSLVSCPSLGSPRIRKGCTGSDTFAATPPSRTR